MYLPALVHPCYFVKFRMEHSNCKKIFLILLKNPRLNISKNAIEVNTDDYSTNISGVWAIGDINTYKNKLKLILCGFHEAALMSHSVYQYIHPGVKYTMKYTTVNGVNSF